MKRTTLLLSMMIVSGVVAAATTHVDGHIRKDGTYVAPHYRTTPDSRRDNNWSSQGNTNPYTGERGTVNPYTPPTPSVPTYPSDNRRRTY